MNLEHELSFGVSTSFCWNCESQQLVKKAPKKDKALIFGCLSDKTSAWDIEKLSITRIFLKGFVMSQIWHMSWQYLNQILILPARFSHFLYRSTNSKGGNSRFLQSAFRTTNHHRDNLSPTFTITAQGRRHSSWESSSFSTSSMAVIQSSLCVFVRLLNLESSLLHVEKGFPILSLLVHVLMQYILAN